MVHPESSIAPPQSNSQTARPKRWQGRSRHCCGGGHLASISDNSETPDHGDGDPGRLMAPHSSSYLHGAARMKVPELWSGCQEQWRGGDGGLLCRWRGRAGTDGEERRLHPGWTTRAGPQRLQEQPRWSWYGRRGQGVDPICSPLAARIGTMRQGRQQEHGAKHCEG